MDYFRSALESAKEQAAKAATEAKALAEQAQASAKLQAEEASKKLQSLQGDLKNLDLKKIDIVSMKSSLSSMTDSVNKAFATYTAGGGSSAQERAEYGLTDDFIELVKGFSYMLFMDFPLEQLEITRDLSPRTMPMVLKLGPWQEKHAMLLVQTIPEFNDLRYVLCPKKMAEERFWEIYFTLCKDKLPAQALKFMMLSAQQSVTVDATAAAVPTSGDGWDDEDETFGDLGAFTLAQDDDEAEVAADSLPRTDVLSQASGSAPNSAAPSPEKAETSAARSQFPQHPSSSPTDTQPNMTQSTAPVTPPGPSRSGAEASTASAAEAEPEDSVHDSEDLVDDVDDEGEEDDFDAYVQGMLGGDGDDEGDQEEDDIEEDDFDAYMAELAKSAGDGSAGDDDDDVSLGSDDIDLADLEDD